MPQQQLVKFCRFQALVKISLHFPENEFQSGRGQTKTKHERNRHMKLESFLVRKPVRGSRICLRHPSCNPPKCNPVLPVLRHCTGPGILTSRPLGVWFSLEVEALGKTPLKKFEIPTCKANSTSCLPWSESHGRVLMINPCLHHVGCLGCF